MTSSVQNNQDLDKAITGFFLLVVMFLLSILAQACEYEMLK